MSKMQKTEICSIFGQIEGVVAHEMAIEGKVHLIPSEMIPPTALFDDQGRRASCALVLNRASMAEFNRRVANLYA